MSSHLVLFIAAALLSSFQEASVSPFFDPLDQLNHARAMSERFLPDGRLASIETFESEDPGACRPYGWRYEFRSMKTETWTNVDLFETRDGDGQCSVTRTLKLVASDMPHVMSWGPIDPLPEGMMRVDELLSRVDAVMPGFKVAGLGLYALPRAEPNLFYDVTGRLYEQDAVLVFNAVTREFQPDDSRVPDRDR